MTLTRSSRRNLSVHFRAGQPVSGYLKLRPTPEAGVDHSQRFEADMVADFAKDGACLGIEFTAPACVTLDAVNRLLRQFGERELTFCELKPLLGETGSLTPA